MCPMSYRREKGRGGKIWKVKLSLKKDSTIKTTQLKSKETVIIYICIVTGKYSTQGAHPVYPSSPLRPPCVPAGMSGGTVGTRKQVEGPGTQQPSARAVGVCVLPAQLSLGWVLLSKHPTWDPELPSGAEPSTHYG